MGRRTSRTATGFNKHDRLREGKAELYVEPPRLPPPTDEERKNWTADEMLELPDNGNLFTQSDTVPRRFWKHDLASLKAILREWKEFQQKQPG